MRVILGILLAASVATSAVGQTAFVAELSGAVNLPASPSTAKGSSIAVLDVATSKLKYQLDVSGLMGTVIAAEASNAAVAANGPTIFTLQGAGNHFAGTSPALTASQVAELRAGRIYLSVRTSAFPFGELRGQLTLGATQYYSALNASKAVPPSSSGESGNGTFELIGDGTILQCSLHATFALGTARLNDGAKGVAGATIATLVQSASFEWSGSVSLTPLEIEKLRAGLLYIEIQPVVSNLAIRGQVSATYGRYGSGCGHPILPTTNAGGVPMPGSSVYVTVDGGMADGIGILFVSPSAQLGTAAGCPIYVGLPAPAIFVITTDVNGSAILPVFQIPMSTPTPTFVQLQSFFLNPAAANGQFTATNGLTFQVSTFPD